MSIFTIDSAHLTFSDFNALTNLVAKSSYISHLAANLSASSLVSKASLSSAFNFAYYSFNTLTFSITIFNFSLASSNYSIAYLRAFLFGSTY